MGLGGEHLAMVRRKGVRVPLIELESSMGWALGVGCGRRGGCSPEREGKKSMVCEEDGGNREVTNKGELVLAREDIINNNRTSTMRLTHEKTRI